MAHTNALEIKNLRRHRRYAVDAGSLEASWLDSMGKMKTTRTRALNVSEEGISLELPEPALPLRVQFQSHRFNINGMGTVRYCRREGNKWVVGLEFTGNLRWSAPQEDVGEPIPLCG